MKILHDHPTFEQAPARPAQTGIFKAGQTWRAVKRGVLVGEFSGTGSKAKAIEAAGSNRVIA